MKTEQLIPLCRRYHAMLLHSDEQTISIAVVNTPPAELMERYASRRKSGIDIECWSQEQMDKRLQAQEKQAQLAQNDGPENIAERVNQISNRPCVSGRLIFISSPRKTHLRIRCGSMASFTPYRCWLPNWPHRLSRDSRSWPVSISPSTVYRRMASSR
ncbi:type IV fimbrial assembly, ATPase PilB [Klebsiella pneumoniae]|uniref:Type IV fimbrial assembly, ATPase PilB n=1 Tax=Klebsiella pneumoniae TaxID=573 RepID=A0A377XLJ4_KLEPN|nr:type IV fimbrial assembly, ATPase PilB [Klebsiella pneumoniae]